VDRGNENQGAESTLAFLLSLSGNAADAKHRTTFNGPVRGSRSRGAVKMGLFELAIIVGGTLIDGGHSRQTTMMFGGSPASGTAGFRNVPNVELSDPFMAPRQNSLLVKVRNQTCDNETETIPTPSHAASAGVGSGRWMSKQKNYIPSLRLRVPRSTVPPLSFEVSRSSLFNLRSPDDNANCYQRSDSQDDP